MVLPVYSIHQVGYLRSYILTNFLKWYRSNNDGWRNHYFLQPGFRQRYMCACSELGGFLLIFHLLLFNCHQSPILIVVCHGSSITTPLTTAILYFIYIRYIRRYIAVSKMQCPRTYVCTAILI